MSRYSGSHDIYKELVEDSEESWLYGLLAFAIIEEQRIEWMRHHCENNGAIPTSSEIQNWYEQQPPGLILRAKGTAESALQAYSEEVQEFVDSEQRKEIEEGIIVSEIRAIGRFWPQFGVNLAGGFVSAIIFAVVLILFTVFVVNDASVVEVGNTFKEHFEVSGNGEAK